MTRFARADGSKSSNKKIPEDSTPWHELKGGLNETSSNAEETSESEGEEVHENDLETTLEDHDSNTWSVIDGASSSNVRKATKRKHKDAKSQGSTFLFNNLGWRHDESEAKRLKDIKDKLLEDGEDLATINNTLTKEVKKSVKKMKHTKSKKCYQCQQVGHTLNDCPEKKESNVCFICGSTEHLFRNCKMKKNSHDKFKFATCFLCKEQGHISTSCPDNPSGLYPYGGSCYICGEVTHFARACPKKQEQQKNKPSTKATLSTISDDVEGLPDDEPISKKLVSQKKVKVVKF